MPQESSSIMTEKPNWKVTALQIMNNQPTGRPDKLYANKHMQVGVNIMIKAITSDSQVPYKLPQSELDKIHLVDYEEGQYLPTPDYAVLTTENEFAHSLPDRRQTPVPPITYSLAKRWVSTEKVQSLNIAAKIQQPDGRWISTRGKAEEGDFDSYIRLTGITPKTYKIDDIEIKREDTQRGEYAYSVQVFDEEWEKFQKNWGQDNYYVTSRDTTHPLLKGEIYNYDHTGGENGRHSDDGLKNCYAHLASPSYSYLRLFYIWDYGQEATKEVGLYKRIKDIEAVAYADITVNQKPNALCLTRMDFEYNKLLFDQAWSFRNCGFKLYDIYGNTGTFSASYDEEHNLVVIKDRTALEAENTDDFKQNSVTFFKLPATVATTSKNDDTLSSEETGQKFKLT